MKKITIVSALIFCLIGCATVGRKINQDAVSRIEKGKTSREDVVRLLGSPDQLTKDTNGNITMMYTYVRVATKPESFIPIVGAFTGGANVQNQMVMVTVGSDGKVVDVFNTFGATESGYGISSGGKVELEDVEDNKRPK